jgi:protein-L-isoaspartate O-methyltransferase
VADAIIVNAGVTHLSSVWLDALASKEGRLLVPLTNAEWWGCFVMITRLGSNPDRYRAWFAGKFGVIPCVGGTRPGSGGKIDGAARERRFHCHPVAAARSRGA